jgi:hypothetical protein
MKFFEIHEKDFPTPAHVIKSFLNFATAMKIKDKVFSFMVVFKDDAAMKITILMD